MIQDLDIQQAIANLKLANKVASEAFFESVVKGEEWADPEWHIEKCFLQLLAIIEKAGLNELYKTLFLEYSTIKKSEKGFSESYYDPDGEQHPMYLGLIRKYASAIEQFYPDQDKTIVSKEVTQILRDIHYTITDKTLFHDVPKEEKDVHIRIEGILRCIFPDLQHKPKLSKPIKNFEPDTGIPSIGTLIEYKYLSSTENIAPIADEVLADTRGYFSKDWHHFIYVIYETNRFRPEKNWVQLLRESGVPENTTIIVLSGEPSKRRIKKAKVAQAAKKKEK